MKEFTEKDVYLNGGNTINHEGKLIYNPPDWIKAGLQETATGYGARLNTGYSIKFSGWRSDRRVFGGLSYNTL